MSCIIFARTLGRKGIPYGLTLWRSSFAAQNFFKSHGIKATSLTLSFAALECARTRMASAGRAGVRSKQISKYGNSMGLASIAQPAKMETTEGLPEFFYILNSSLGRFVKQRAEALYIRHVLALHVGSQARPSSGYLTQQQLSFVDETWKAQELSSSASGLHIEYRKCVEANIAAQTQFVNVRSKHTAHSDHNSRKHKTRSHEAEYNYDGNGPLLCSHYIDLVGQQQKLERIDIIQSYLESLLQRPAANADFIAPEIVLENVSLLPRIPSEVIPSGGYAGDTEPVDLERLVERLEKTVLRAKMLLKKEQVLFAQVKAASTVPDLSPNEEALLEALGRTRNELITWIESELSKTGETPSDTDEGPGRQYDQEAEVGKIKSELEVIRKQYATYLEVRRRLVISAAEGYQIPSALTPRELLTAKDGHKDVMPRTNSLHPYLLQLLTISGEQKSTIQQKSRLTTSLAKHIKDANQGLNQVAEESHLLPAYKIPAKATQRQGLESVPGGEWAAYEHPDSSHQARNWAHASQSASINLKGTVMERLEEGEEALTEAREALSKLLELLGLQSDGVGAEKGVAQADVWASINGNLAKIND